MNASNSINKLLGTFTYKVDVEIFEQRAGNIVIYKDRAKRLVDEGVEKYHLLKRNKMIVPPKFKNLFIDGKGRTMLKLYQPQTGQYLPIQHNDSDAKLVKYGEGIKGEDGKIAEAKPVPMGFINPDPKLTVEDKDVRFWYMQEMKEANQAYDRRSKWAAIMPFVLLTTMAIMIFLQVLFFNKGMGVMTGGINAAAQTFKESVSIAAGLP